MVEDTGLKIIALRSPWRASSPNQISCKPNKRFKSYEWRTHRLV